MIILNLRVLMAKKKINMQQLSEETGIRRATISAYYNETYRHLVKDHLNIFCRYFNCDISDLIEFVNDDED
ncbi:helix-turn-helix transcriptional regulator [Clostridium botulinum]|uniref:helix-turn-helix domain-containing protein n=1 Tax=Clostridium botulinum TaxID=1491 RepID=UPI0014009E37|nr:helix-turn-helix transcriptional regulator [Clostridium botulinum]MBY6837827.1 helix-turn-helix transcriptional regulator [Clostridium botulinum]NFG65895.1 helix-turn-helix transcriptional regulator [Clostridium botulinum]NFQ24745.1 helix-turn-helix transcriptional regulator [Clostridium botulinum]